MAGLDADKRWKASRVSALVFDADPYGTKRGSGEVEIHLGGERSSPLGRFLPAEPCVHQGS